MSMSRAPVDTTTVLLSLHVSHADGGNVCLASRAGSRVMMAVPKLSPRKVVPKEGSDLALSGTGADQKVRNEVDRIACLKAICTVLVAAVSAKQRGHLLCEISLLG